MSRYSYTNGRTKRKTIAEVRKHLFYSLVYASWYAVNKRHMLQRWQWHKDNTPQLATFFYNLSPAKRAKLVSDAWRYGVPNIYIDMRLSSRALVRKQIANLMRKLEDETNEDSEDD